MIKFEHTEVMGWETAIRGMRNPMNSWDRSDSGYCKDFRCKYAHDKDDRPICPLDDRNCGCFYDYIIGPNDHALMMQLVDGGPVHAKFRRMITMYVDITAPLYWWKEFDTYKVGTVTNSCSTMHKIADKEFALEDFSCEHLIDHEPIPTRIYSAKEMMKTTIENLNLLRRLYMDISRELKDAMDHYQMLSPTKNDDALKIKALQESKKTYWWQMIQLLPSSYNQKRTVMLNYEVLSNIYKSRKYHKLDEWREFCKWIETSPYSEIITGAKREENK